MDRKRIVVTLCKGRITGEIGFCIYLGFSSICSFCEKVFFRFNLPMCELNKYVGNGSPYPAGSTPENTFVQKTLSGTQNIFNSQLRGHKVQPHLTNCTACWFKPAENNLLKFSKYLTNDSDAESLLYASIFQMNSLLRKNFPLWMNPSH